MKKQYKKPMTEVFDLKVMRLMDDSQVVIYSTTVNQNSDDNTDDEGSFAREGVLGWSADDVLPHGRNLWDD